MYEKILLINLMHLGDLLLTTPILRTLRTNYQKSHITLLADEKLSGLVKYNPTINEIIAIDKKGYHNRLKNYLKLVKDLRDKKYDLVINLHANERASFCAAFSGGKKIVGYATIGLNLMFDGVIKNRKTVKHQIEAHFDVLRELLQIEKIDDRGIEMYLDEKTEQWADDFFKKTFIQEPILESPLPIIALNPGASWPTKRWGCENYAQLADQILQSNHALVFLGGSMDQDIVREITSKMHCRDHPLLKVFTGELSLLELAAVLKRCSVLITNDSGPMHMAVAMDLPLVAIFGPSPVVGYYPYSNKSISLKTSLPCQPCGKHHCDSLECMKNIPVETVFKHTINLLEKYMNIPRPLPRELGGYCSHIIELEN